MQELQNKIQIGARVLFGGGIYGKIVKIKGDVIDVEMAKGLVVQISRFGSRTSCQSRSKITVKDVENG